MVLLEGLGVFLLSAVAFSCHVSGFAAFSAVAVKRFPRSLSFAFTFAFPFSFAFPSRVEVALVLVTSITVSAFVVSPSPFSFASWRS